MNHGAEIKLMFFLVLLITSSALSIQNPKSVKSSSTQINSNSVLVALLDSHYTELSELVEKALLLQTLEQAASIRNITIFAPSSEALERQMDPEFKRFLLEPRNLKSLQNLLLFHMVPSRVGSGHGPGHHKTLCVEESDNHLPLTTSNSGEKLVGGVAKITRPDDIIRPDGLIHGIERLLVPRSVQEEFNKRRSLTSITAIIPKGAPVVDPRAHRLKKKKKKKTVSVPAGSPPVLPVYDELASGPSIAPAPARHHFDGESQVKDFIQTLLHYGGYNELADILVNLTSLATEMGKLVSKSYVLTVLAPNDDTMSKLTTDQLSDPGAPEQIMYYHIIPEYQTEESRYNSVRRFGKVQYDTLRLPHKVTAEEADGSCKFGSGDGSAYLFDPDIYTDERISLQGMDGVLFPVEKAVAPTKATTTAPKVVANQRRGKLLEIACSIVT